MAAVRTSLGGHAMLLVGYDDGDGTFIVRNSWGADWGDRGYCRMSYETFQTSLAANTTWILGKLEAAGDFTVTRPALTSKPVDGSVKDMAARMRDEIRAGLAKDIADSFADVKKRFTPPGRQG